VVAAIALLVLLAIRLSISIAGHETPAWWEVPIIIVIAIGFWAASHRFVGPLLDRVVHGTHQSYSEPARAEEEEPLDSDEIT
jgi:hypothetical protein